MNPTLQVRNRAPKSSLPHPHGRGYGESGSETAPGALQWHPTQRKKLPMTLRFSPLPGTHERRLQRMAGNPLFPEGKRAVSMADVATAQRRDAQELQQFQTEIQRLLREAVALAGQVESDVVLSLKERLDMAYERSAGLAGRQDEIQQALRRLIGVIMATVRSHAEGDPQALQRLDEEDAARAAHFELQGFPLVADLLREDTVIETDELVATLLSESRDALAAALHLFDAGQLSMLVREGSELLERCEQEGHTLPEARERLREMESRAASAPVQQTIN